MAGYSIKKDNLVVIWLDSEETPGNLEQPTWPDGTKWASKAEAEAWAKAWLAHRDDETKPMPGNGPDQATIPTLSAEEVEKIREEKIAEIEANLAEQVAIREAAEKAAEELAEAEKAARDAEVTKAAEAQAE